MEIQRTYMSESVKREDKKKEDDKKKDRGEWKRIIVKYNTK